MTGHPQPVSCRDAVGGEAAAWSGGAAGWRSWLSQDPALSLSSAPVIHPSLEKDRLGSMTHPRTAEGPTGPESSNSAEEPGE